MALVNPCNRVEGLDLVGIVTEITSSDVFRSGGVHLEETSWPKTEWNATKKTSSACT
jgi:hypothetical protein